MIVNKHVQNSLLVFLNFSVRAVLIYCCHFTIILCGLIFDGVVHSSLLVTVPDISRRISSAQTKKHPFLVEGCSYIWEG